MGARRGTGEGSVFQRKDGYWVARVELGRGPDGKRRRGQAVRRRKVDALAALKDLQRQADRGVAPDRTRTVGQFLDWWLVTILPGTVRESTEGNYRRIVEYYITPHVGDVPLGKLTPAHVATMLRTLEAGGWKRPPAEPGGEPVKVGKLSPRTRQYARAVLRRALRWAEQNGLIDRNAAALADGPKASATKLDDSLTADQARAVLAKARTWHKAEDGRPARPHRLEALAVVVLRLGLRKGEALALRWPDVDLEAGELTVRGTLKRRDGGGLYIDRPKTRAGVRTVPLVAGTLDALREHRRRQAAEQLEAIVWHDSGHVFANEIGGPLDPRNATRWWYQLTEAAGVGRRRFHASRHTAATLMLDQGVPLEVVSAILGHAGLSITADVYARVTGDAKRRALGSLADVLS